MHLSTNDFEQSSISQSETNYTPIEQFYCDKLHCIRSDIVKNGDVCLLKHSLIQMQQECFKQIEACSNPFVKIFSNAFMWIGISDSRNH